MDMQSGVWVSPRIEKLAALFLVAATIFVAFLAVQAAMDWWESSPTIGNVITVEGEGKATAIPDIATISFTVTGEGKNASAAQDEATKKINVAVALLKEKGIKDTDVKTTSYNVSPKYSYPQPCYNAPCVYDEQRVIGYTVTQSTEVKIRKTGEVGDVLTALGDAGISMLYGPNFTVEDPDAVMAAARKQAIGEARAKAEILAQDLGVSLGKVVNFYENSGGYPVPYYSRDMAMGMGGAVAMEAKVAPEVPVGENEIVSRVSITYEIR